MSNLKLITLQSDTLGKPCQVAYLPPNTLTTSGHCFTLYLFHGMGGDHLSWITNTAVETLIKGQPILVVMPSVGDTFYLDSPVGNAESYICLELLPFFDSQFPTIGHSSGRAVTGLSMGGYGALLIALRHPELFGSAASHSGAVLTSRARHEVGIKWELADLLYGVGSNGESKRRAHDLLFLAQNLQHDDAESGKRIYDGPSLYLDCGTEDFLFYASRTLTESLRMAQIPYEYGEVPGEHNWQYWDQRLPKSLEFHGRGWGLSISELPRTSLLPVRR